MSAAEKLEIDPVEIAENTMLGDLMQMFVDEFKALPDVWQKLPEHKQREVIDRVNSRCQNAIFQAVQIVASEARPTISATVEKVEFKDGIKATLAMQRNSASRHDLADSAGGQVLLVVMNAEQYEGGSEEVTPDPDQPGLSLEQDYEDDLYGKAVEYVRESGRAVISGVQRELKVGYNRAARLIEKMEQEGIVTALDSNGKREVISH